MVAMAGEAMLRITDVLHLPADGRATWTLRLSGALDGEWVDELRASWRRIETITAAGAPMRVDLADLRSVDAAGKALLAEMNRDGVVILGGDRLAAAVGRDVVAGCVRQAGVDSSGGMPCRPSG